MSMEQLLDDDRERKSEKLGQKLTPVRLHPIRNPT
jgi:hypothetical protein